MKAMRPLLIGAGLLSVILFAMWIIPWFLASGRSSNVAHSPLIGLRMLAAAEEDFRNTDRDGNGVRDYWVGDVSGLYYLLDRDTPIKLIEPSMADRDEHPIRKNAGKRTFLAAGFPPNDAWKYAVIPETPSGLPYGKDLDGDGLPYENKDAYAFCGWPRTYSPERRETWITNETGRIWKKDLGGMPVRRFPADPAKERWILAWSPEN